MKTELFSFHLPEELIAQSPAEPRDSCRLMVLDRREHVISHRQFSDLPELLKKGDVLVMNNSMVIPARMLFREKGRNVELFLLKKKSDMEWHAIGKPGKILQPGRKFFIAPDFSFEVLEILPDGQRIVRFDAREDELDLLIERYGQTPLPPYIRHSTSKPEDYQTVYAKHKGSVAAPTAGLHFTPRLLERIEQMGVRIVFVTLHVGLGTFMPIKSEDIENHTMHSEIFELSADAASILQNAKKEGSRIVAVGTTSVRVLESSFGPGGFLPRVGETSIYIYPGYTWKCVDALITNFHLPKSSLLLLTCSFGGTDFILKAYEEAVEKKNRFYSFGDAMFIM